MMTNDSSWKVRSLSSLVAAIGATIAATAIGCKGSPVNGTQPAMTSPRVSEAVADAAQAYPSSDAVAEPNDNANVVRVQRLGPDGSVVSDWTRGPNDPPAVTAGRLDVAPFQHPSPDRWYYFVADREYAFTVLLQANGQNRPRAETQEVTLIDGSKTTESKITLVHGDNGAFLEVIATPLVGPKLASDIEATIGLHVVAAMDARGFSFLGMHCSPIANSPSCSVAAERKLGTKTLRAAFWTAYLEKANLLVSFNAFETDSTETRYLAAELVQKTFSLGSPPKVSQ